MNEAVLYERRGQVAIITINRPEARNAIDRAVREGMFAALHRVEAEPEVQVAILTGAGDRAFCAGMDLKEAAAEGRGVMPRGFLPVIGDTVEMTKPTIAAVNGFAMAGGWMFAQMCDLCVAAEHAVFAITEAKVGRGTPWAAPLIGMLPQRIAMEVLLTGEPIGARRLLELGYVNQVVPGPQLMEAALVLAERIAANAPLTVRACRELVHMSQEMGRSAALRAARHLFQPVYASEDAKEGPRAFAEKRKPVWQGR
ncbi:enoyl-CoA hydratase-related protein [Siccirubricoccus sp. G192]|uniref:enoyl-CoA hydratase-related protein n=1 Tax=Siccirubricoccus sp. G192 TaxID=2849651 RepID=UPI001C2B95C1|nr:enoyl-CoA hydratase-related protein [Siccirubricoccus sp. G192]MBV1798474.1 enoyl-CoA hydratase/isomerase family protein [Siccirubricoccus sp. G192]